MGNNGTSDCYGPSYANATEQSVVEYYEATVAAEIQYPTYQWLANATIVPSNSTAYNLSVIEKALTKASGAVPYVSVNSTGLMSGRMFRTHSTDAYRGVVLHPHARSTPRCQFQAGRSVDDFELQQDGPGVVLHPIERVRGERGVRAVLEWGKIVTYNKVDMNRL